MASSIRAAATSGPSSSMSTLVTLAPAARSSWPASSSAVRATAALSSVARGGLRADGALRACGGPVEELRELLAVESQQPDRQLPVARVVGEHEDMSGGPYRHGAGRDAALGAGDADGGHGLPPGDSGNEIGTVGGEWSRSRSRALCRLARAAPAGLRPACRSG